MEQKINLRKLEHKTAAIIYQTGVVDIGIGLVWVVSTLAMFFDEIRYYIYLLYLVPPIFIFIVVRYVVQPRMGVFELRKKRTRKKLVAIVVITLFLVSMVTLTFFGITNFDKGIINPRWIITGIIFAICVAVAYFFEFNRMYFYAFLLAGSFNLFEFLRDHPGYVSNRGIIYLLTSCILVAIGLFYFFSFLKKYPVTNEQYQHE